MVRIGRDTLLGYGVLSLGGSQVDPRIPALQYSTPGEINLIKSHVG